jgi:serine/threonine protein kinase
MNSPPTSAGAARASSARAAAAASPRTLSAQRPASATGHHHRPLTTPAAAAAASPPPLSPRGAGAAPSPVPGASSHGVVAAAAAAATAVTAVTAPAAAHDVDAAAPASARGAADGHAVVPLVLPPPPPPPPHPHAPPPQIRAAHEVSAGSSAGGGGGGGGGSADGPPAAHHPGYAPLATTDPTLTTHAVVPPSDVLRDGDFHAAYLLGEQLGSGSYGTVHRCERRSDGELFAVKVLALAGGRGEHRLPEIEDEVRLWRRVQEAQDSAAAAAAAAAAGGGGALSPSPSPAVTVRLVSAHRDLTAAYLVQELCGAGDLQGVLDRQAADAVEAAGLEARAAAGDAGAAAALAASGPPRPGGFPGALPEPLAAAAMASVLRFIAACHDAGVVFGDVKPSNFLLSVGEEEEAEGEDGAAPPPPSSSTPAQRLERKRRALLRLRGADYGTALALPSADGTCDIHHRGGCACADLSAFSPSPARNNRVDNVHSASSGRSSQAVVDAAFAHHTAPAPSPPRPPSPLGGDGAAGYYASECVPPRGLSGTPVFMAPELIRERRAGPAADCWAAGAMAYLLLSGRLPFWPDVDVADLARLPPARVLAEVAAAPLALEHPRATAHLSPEARGFLARLMERDPARRATARAALAHPFLAGAVAEAAALDAGAPPPPPPPPPPTTGGVVSSR